MNRVNQLANSFKNINEVAVHFKRSGSVLH